MAYGRRSRVTKVIDASDGNYAAADIVSESKTAGTAWEFTQMANAGAGTPCMIYYANVTCSEDSVAWRLRLHLYSAALSANTMLNDNVTKAFDNDDRLNYEGYIDFPAMADTGEGSMAQVEGMAHGYWLGQNGTTLYGVLETLDAETNETAGMSLTITLFSMPVA